MTTQVSLSPDTLRLIECRLDSLDRILMASGIGRGERLDVVQAVEDQIHELIERRTDGEPTREDVVGVLRELDPPEAYIPHAMETPPQELWQPREQKRPEPPPVPTTSGWAIAAFVLALLSIPTMIVIPLGSLLVLISSTMVATMLAMGTFTRHRGRWMAVTAQVIVSVHYCFVLAVLLMQ